MRSVMTLCSAPQTLVALLFSAVLVNCSSGNASNAGNGGAVGSGGETGKGGSPGTGGATASGGAPGTGGATTTAGAGGSPGNGGSPALGGSSSAAGGSSANGGSSATGGSSSAAGGSSSSSGGASAAGGSSGGASASGGSSSSGAGGGSQGGGTGTCPTVADFTNWTSGKAPLDMGKLAASAFLSHTGDGYGGDGYAWAFTYVADLQFTKLTGDNTTNAKLISDFDAFLSGSKSVPANPTPMTGTNNVDTRAFGDLPLEVYLENGNMMAKTMGLARADTQWSATTSEGYTQDTRWWADDMFMITGLQVQAYRATKDQKYLDRMAKLMIAYFAKLQHTDGLFQHTDQSLAYWGRANGWVAAGMTEMLLEMPAGADRDAIMAGYKKQMDGLVKLQLTSGTDPGAWNQVLDVTSTIKPEMSCTAMFTFALATGVKNGWLTDAKYSTAAKNGWNAVAKRVSSAGLLGQVCPGTGDARSVSGLAAQQKFYMDISFPSDDRHGQAPLLWAARALLRTDCPGMR